ncbi:hypothetical protein [Magnetococcus marinus]|nr:hypothetical protein [Magnetococcus marinus]
MTLFAGLIIVALGGARTGMAEEVYAWQVGMGGGWQVGPAWMLTKPLLAPEEEQAGASITADATLFVGSRQPALSKRSSKSVKQPFKQQWLDGAQQLAGEVDLPAWMGLAPVDAHKNDPAKKLNANLFNARWQPLKPGRLELVPGERMAQKNPVQWKGVLSQDRGNYLQARWQQGSWKIESAVGNVDGDRYQMQTRYKLSSNSSVKSELNDGEERLMWDFSSYF